jgi:hypothetical protein
MRCLGDPSKRIAPQTDNGSGRFTGWINAKTKPVIRYLLFAICYLGLKGRTHVCHPKN